MTAGLRKPLRWALTGMQRLRRAFWYFRRPRTFGVHAAPLTPGGKVVLVKLRYARGWRLPGGGRKETEDPREAVIRELREEIGMTAFGSVEPVTEVEQRPDFKRDRASLFVVRDVAYRPRWSLEVEAVMEADPDRLPAEMAEPALQWMAAIRPMLKQSSA